MRIQHAGAFRQGYEAIVDRADPDVLMDFGVLTLGPGEAWASGEADEKALLLTAGEVELVWSSGRSIARRKSLLDESPAVLHLPEDAGVRVVAGPEGAELLLARTPNPRRFEPRFYAPGDCRSEQRGKGTMQETSTRIVRTVFDGANAPEANLVLGEVVTAPGRWSSYPPHHHPQPEIYHYRFVPEQGIGLTAIGQEAHLLRHRDTVVIRDGQDHPQVAAPGYAMWYAWIIRHLDGNRYGTPIFTSEHAWVQDPGAAIWSLP